MQQYVICENVCPKFGVDEKTMKECGEILMKIACDELCLFTKTHWMGLNVCGPRMQILKEMFDEQSKLLLCEYEKTGEQIREFGFRVPFVTEMLKVQSRLGQMKDGEWPDEHTMVKKLLDDHEKLCCELCKDRKRVGDDMKLASVENFIICLERCHKKMAWKLRAHTEKGTESPTKA